MASHPPSFKSCKMFFLSTVAVIHELVLNTSLVPRLFQNANMCMWGEPGIFSHVSMM